MRASQLAQASEMGWFSNTSFTTGLKTLPTFRPDALVFFRAKMIFALKKTRASGRNVGKVFNPVVKLVLENQPISEVPGVRFWTLVSLPTIHLARNLHDSRHLSLCLVAVPRFPLTSLFVKHSQKKQQFLAKKSQTWML